MIERGCDQSDVAEGVGITQSAVSQILNGGTRNSRHLPAIADFMAINLAYLAGTSDDRIDMFDERGVRMNENDLMQRAIRDRVRADMVSPPASDKFDEDDTVEVQEIDIAYGMGGGTYLDLPVKAETRKFSRGFLRNFTDAPPSRIFVARGMGDSMMPTILDADIVLIDTSEMMPRMADKIWALTFNGMGMIKRLRPTSDQGWSIMSDNPSVSDITAYDGEMSIVGRVVAIVRKV